MASKLAGRLTFFSQSVFGCCGRAAVKPLYARVADTAALSDAVSVGRPAGGASSAASPGGGRHPAAGPMAWPGPGFLPGPLRPRVGYLQADDPVPRSARWQNGWGFVLLLDGQVFYDFGVIRPKHLRPFASRRASYVLEILAQVLPVITFARRLPQQWLAFPSTTSPTILLS